jgi:hypothetical protein
VIKPVGGSEAFGDDLRSDTEFKNYSLNEFLSDAGIKYQYSAAYTCYSVMAPEKTGGV